MLQSRAFQLLTALFELLAFIFVKSNVNCFYLWCRFKQNCENWQVLNFVVGQAESSIDAHVCFHGDSQNQGRFHILFTHEQRGGVVMGFTDALSSAGEHQCSEGSGCVCFDMLDLKSRWRWGLLLSVLRWIQPLHSEVVFLHLISPVVLRWSDLPRVTRDTYVGDNLGASHVWWRSLCSNFIV